LSDALLLKPEAFEALVGSTFKTSIDGMPLALELREVERMTPPGAAAPRTDPFSLLFHGPRIPALDQGVVKLEHVALGSLEIFIVPLGPDARGQCYEAIFN
jgi:hypothetical protein